MNDIPAIQLHKKHMDEHKSDSARHAQESVEKAHRTAEALDQVRAAEPAPAEPVSPYPQAWDQFGDAREHQPPAKP